MGRVSCTLFLLFTLHHPSLGQDSSAVSRKRLTWGLVGASATYSTSMLLLDRVWYSDFGRQSFRFFNDASEWNQVDKVGHFYSAFYLSSGASAGLKWTGLPGAKSNAWGSLIGWAALSTIEWFDGRSIAYGASVSDLGANAAGAGFYLLQQRLWKEVRIRPKFSFHFTTLGSQRPATLGSGYEQIIKDYNGQTYWLAWSPGSMHRGGRWPAWLMLSLGYGTHDMIFARNFQNRAIGMSPYRQFYLSLDIDPDRLPIQSKALKKVLAVFRMIRVPLPALEVSRKGWRAHPIYF